MNYAHPTLQLIQVSSLASEQRRQRLVAAVISLTKGTALAATPHEQHLLTQYQRGRLTIDEIVYSLEASIQFNASQL